MNICRWLNALILLFLLTGCAQKKEPLSGFDTQRWVDDRKGCKNHRLEMSEIILSQKARLLGRDEIEIVAVLGKPDENELFKRNQKFFYYYLEPAEACPTPHESARKLVIRFNAVGLAKEILTE